jgi:hypothetical protein
MVVIHGRHSERSEESLYLLLPLPLPLLLPLLLPLQFSLFAAPSLSHLELQSPLLPFDGSAGLQPCEKRLLI